MGHDLHVLAHTAVLSAASAGLSLLAQALCPYPLRAWLDGAWTRGRPLNCWTCMIGWSALFIEGALHWRDPLGGDMLAVLGAIGVAAPIMRRLHPFAPVDGPEFGEGEGDE